MAAVAAVSTLFIISAAQAQFQRREAPLAMPPHQIPCSPDARVGVPRSGETTGSRTLSDQLADNERRRDV
jgi:hypothetical protein